MVIFDNGSQRSYITERARDRLALVASGRKDMFIAIFAAKSNRVQSCDVVKVIMEIKDGGKLLLTLLTTAIICEPIVSRSLHECVFL